MCLSPDRIAQASWVVRSQLPTDLRLGTYDWLVLPSISVLPVLVYLRACAHAPKHRLRYPTFADCLCSSTEAQVAKRPSPEAQNALPSILGLPVFMDLCT